jgi:hypothetical protein
MPSGRTYSTYSESSRTSSSYGDDEYYPQTASSAVRFE